MPYSARRGVANGTPAAPTSVPGTSYHLRPRAHASTSHSVACGLPWGPGDVHHALALCCNSHPCRVCLRAGRNPHHVLSPGEPVPNSSFPKASRSQSSAASSAVSSLLAARLLMRVLSSSLLILDLL